MSSIPQTEGARPAKTVQRGSILHTCPICSSTFHSPPAAYRHYCSMACYIKARTHVQEPSAPMRPRTIAERFWAHVDRSGGPNACWPWTGYLSKRGYGRFSLSDGTSKSAHRVAWELEHGCSVLPFIEICHNCPNGDNPTCVNPRHLFMGTRQDNAADCVAKGRSARGERSGQAKLRDADVLDIRARYAAHQATVRHLAEEYGVTRGAIELIVCRKRWKHL